MHLLTRSPQVVEKPSVRDVPQIQTRIVIENVDKPVGLLCCTCLMHHVLKLSMFPGDYRAGGIQGDGAGPGPEPGVHCCFGFTSLDAAIVIWRIGSARECNGLASLTQPDAALPTRDGRDRTPAGRRW